MAQHSDQIARNVRLHDQVATTYDKHHPEIFNPIEQARLEDALARGRAAVRSAGGRTIAALDFGSGSGNLTRLMLGLGMDVTASDVSPHFLRLIEQRFGGAALRTHQLNGSDLAEFGDASFDFIATYSVLHHVPDYLAAVAELARVCRPGGVIMIDHERSTDYWQRHAAYQAFEREATLPNPAKFLRPTNYYGKIRRLFDPRYTNEGDIHVWQDDHIEWPRIVEVLAQHGCRAVIDETYLNFSASYRPAIYEAHRTTLADMQLMLFRRDG